MFQASMLSGLVALTLSLCPISFSLSTNSVEITELKPLPSPSECELLDLSQDTFEKWMILQTVC